MIIATHQANGQITGIMSGPRNSIEAAMGSGTHGVVITHEDEINNKYVLNGQLVEKGEPPSEAHTFDYDSKQWVYNLEAQKADKWQGIKVERDSQEFSTFEWNSYTFDCDEVSQRRIQGAVQLAALDTNTVMDWTLADNTVQTFNATELQQIGQALGAHVNACHVKARGLRDQINAAESEAELSVIRW